MAAEFADERPVFLSTLPAGRVERRLAFAVVLFSLFFFCVIAPFAKTPLARVWAFIPVYDTAVVLNNVVTALLLFGQYSITRSKASLVLASGYMYVAFIAVVHALSFPGAFAPTGLFESATQTTAWLYMFWHAGFPFFVIAYSLLRDSKRPNFPQRSLASGQPALTIAASIAAVLLVAGAFTFLAASANSLLPLLMRDHQYQPVFIIVISCVWGLSFLALLILWQRGPHSMLDLWLMVVLCSWIFDIALSAIVNQGRFDLGFYSGRIYGLLAASFVLMMLLLENSMLYAGLVRMHDKAYQKTLDLQQVSAQLESTNEVLAKKNRQLRDASQHKSAFLANMSHELRTPLNAVIGFSEVLKDGLIGDLNESQHEYVTDIFSSGQHLLALINDILDLSKIEAGKMVLELEPVEIVPLLRNSMSIIKENASDRGIKLVFDVPETLGMLQADARRIKQIVYNLLSNAVKFSPDGRSVALKANLVTRGSIDAWRTSAPTRLRLPLPAGDFTDFLEISVTDHGNGIAPQDAPRLFQAFTQLDNTLSRGANGTGLGLALIHSLALLHGGTVALSSTPERGSCFTVWIPWRAPENRLPAQIRLPAIPPGQPLALLIEDNNRAAELIRLQLEPEGFTVLRATDAAEGLRLLEITMPTVIILDILLPDMDGWDLLAKIKHKDSPSAAIPVIIVSIVASAQRGFSLGAAQVLQKPVTRDELLLALENIGVVRIKPPIRILVIDDDPKAVELIHAFLSIPGYEVLRAHGGREGIEVCGRELPDLLILDLLMPEVSGFDVVRALQNDPVTSAIPVIVVTAKTLTNEDHALLGGFVTSIIVKAGINDGKFAGEVHRVLAEIKHTEKTISS